MKTIDFLRNIRFSIQRVCRLLKVNRRSEIVWNDLIKMHEKAGWGFGQDANQKSIELTFSNTDESSIKLYHEISNNKIVFRAVILSNFDVDNTHDIMILSSLINSSINFGSVRADTINNCVHFVYSGDLLLYFFYPGEKHSDMFKHIEIAKECHWAFNYMLNTKDNPASVIVEFIKRNDQEIKEKKLQK